MTDTLLGFSAPWAIYAGLLVLHRFLLQTRFRSLP